MCSSGHRPAATTPFTTPITTWVGWLTNYEGPRCLQVFATTRPRIAPTGSSGSGFPHSTRAQESMVDAGTHLYVSSAWRTELSGEHVLSRLPPAGAEPAKARAVERDHPAAQHESTREPSHSRASRDRRCLSVLLHCLGHRSSRTPIRSRLAEQDVEVVRRKRCNDDGSA